MTDTRPTLIYEVKTCACCKQTAECLLARRAYTVDGETRYHVWWRCAGCGENALGGRWVGRAEVESYRVTRDELPIRERGHGSVFGAMPALLPGFSE